MLLPPISDIALKEWAVTVKALAQGDQIIIIRKGGIHIEDKEFRVVHPEFLMYPTYEHQNADLVKPEYHQSLRDTEADNDVPGLVTLGYWCQVTDKFELSEQEAVDSLEPFHICTNDYAQQRAHWRPKQPLTVALLRVYELQQAQALPILDEYGGCKSWVELGQEVPLGGMAPVLSTADYEEKAEKIRMTLDGVATAV